MSIFKCNLCSTVLVANELEEHMEQCQGIQPINSASLDTLIDEHFQCFQYSNDKYNQFAEQVQGNELVKSFEASYGGRFGYEGPAAIAECISDIKELEKELGMSLKTDNMGLDFIAYP
ncbi:hypothetical protein ACFL35_17355 [Candidatus Riflebacteria bacterium]